MKKLLAFCLTVTMLLLTLQASAASPECNTCNSSLALGEVEYSEVVDWAALSAALKKANQDEQHVQLLEQFIDDGFTVAVEGSRLFDLGEGYMALMMPVFRGDEIGIIYSVSHPEEPMSVVASVYGSESVMTTWVSEGELQSSETELPSGIMPQGVLCDVACALVAHFGCEAACNMLTLNPVFCAPLCTAGTAAMCSFICSMEVGEPGAPKCGIPGLPDCCGTQPWPDCD